MIDALFPIRRLSRCESGSTAVEFSIIALVLIMTVFGLLEFGRGFYLYNKIAYAADLASRKGLTDSTSTDAAIQEEVLSAFTSTDPVPTVTISAKTFDSTSKREYKTFEVKVPFQPLIPAFGVESFQLKVTRRVIVFP